MCDFTKREVRDYHLIDSHDFREDLNNSKLLDNGEFQDLNSSEMVSLYHSTISAIVNKHCPVKVKTFKRDKSKRWFNDGQLKRERRKYERAYIKSPSIKNQELYKLSKNKYT